MKKKGFTLIELLAVILILAIIAVIVTPIISKIIDEAKTQADKRSAEKFVRAAQVYYTEAQVDEEKSIFLGTNVINQLDLENTDAEGSVVVNTDGSIEMAIVIGKKCYTKTATQDIKDIQVSKDIENCAVFSSSVTISSIESKTDSIVITVDPGDSGVTMTSCKFGRTRGDYTNDGVIEGNTCTLTPLENGKKYYYEITFSDGSKRSGGMQAGTGEILKPNNGGGSSSGGLAGGDSGSGGSSGGSSDPWGGVAAPVLEGDDGQTIYTGWYLSKAKIVYWDVTNGVKCSTLEWSDNGGGAVHAMNSGCLRFYAYMEDNLSYTMILDRNLENLGIAWASSGNNASGPTTSLNRLNEITGSWKGTITPSNYTYILGGGAYVIPYGTNEYKARFITTDEIAHITKNESFNSYSSGTSDWYYLDGYALKDTDPKWQTQIATAEKESEFKWLFNYTGSCKGYGCTSETGGYGSYNLYSHGYWTSDAIAGSSTEAWIVHRSGSIKPIGWGTGLGTSCGQNGVANSCHVGLRPVVTILKSALQ